MFMMSFLMGSFAAFFSVLPLRIRFFWRILLAVLIYAVSFKGMLQKLAGGPMFFAPDLPGWVIRINSALYVWLFFFVLMLALALPFRLIFYAVYWKCRISVEKLQNGRKGYNLCNLILLGISLALAALSLYNSCSMPEIRVLCAAVKDLPPEWEGRKIVFLTDLHIDKVTSPEEIRSLVKRSNALVPDLVLLGGDLVDGTVRQLHKKVRELEGLKSRYGVYAVPGNHEYFSSYRPWKEFLEGSGIDVLENKTERLPGGLYLSGISDPVAKRYGEEQPDLKKVMADVPEGSPAILLSHRPGGLDEASARYSLCLSGHTHGGMVYGLDLLVGLMNDGYYAGSYDVNGMQLYVSAGTTIWRGFPARLGHPAEITLVILRTKGDPADPGGKSLIRQILFFTKDVLKKVCSVL